MTDEREPTIEPRRRTTHEPARRHPTTAARRRTRSTLRPPLTPASRHRRGPLEHEVASASEPVPAARSCHRQPPRKRRPRPLGRRHRGRRAGHRRLGGRRRAHHRSVVDRRPSLGYVPAGHASSTARSASTCPATSAPRSASSCRKFPGFADQAALETKLDEVLDQLVSDATNGEQTYTADIKPWFDGELAFSVGPLPPAPAASSDDPASPRHVPGPGPALDQGPGARPGLVRRRAHRDRREDDDRDLRRPTLTVFEATDGADRRACAIVDGKVAVAGDVASVKAAIDTKGSSGFAAEPGPKAALDSVDGRPRRLRLRRAPALARLVERV